MQQNEGPITPTPTQIIHYWDWKHVNGGPNTMYYAEATIVERYCYIYGVVPPTQGEIYDYQHFLQTREGKYRLGYNIANAFFTKAFIPLNFPGSQILGGIGPSKRSENAAKNNRWLSHLREEKVKNPALDIYSLSKIAKQTYTRDPPHAHLYSYQAPRAYTPSERAYWLQQSANKRAGLPFTYNNPVDYSTNPVRINVQQYYIPPKQAPHLTKAERGVPRSILKKPEVRTKIPRTGKRVRFSGKLTNK